MFCGSILLQRKITDGYPRLPFPKDGHILSEKKRLQVNVMLLKARAILWLIKVLRRAGNKGKSASCEHEGCLF